MANDEKPKSNKPNLIDSLTGGVVNAGRGTVVIGRKIGGPAIIGSTESFKGISDSLITMQSQRPEKEDGTKK